MRSEWTQADQLGYLDDLIWRMEQDELPISDSEIRERGRGMTTEEWLAFCDTPEMNSVSALALLECISVIQEFRALLAATSGMEPGRVTKVSPLPAGKPGPNADLLK